MKRVYIAHPYKEKPTNCKKSADAIVHTIMQDFQCEVLPISPLHLFSWIEEEGDARSHIMSACIDLMKTCDEVWVFDSLSGEKASKSEGVMKEVTAANKHNIPVQEIDLGNMVIVGGQYE